MLGKTMTEKILSRKSGRDARAGDLVVCEIDYALGTDGSVPMAIDYFEQMGSRRVAHPERIIFAMDHYVPSPNPKTGALHERMRHFARQYGIFVHGVGDGVGHQLMVETGRAAPGRLLVGADSHSVMYGALGCFATGIGSSDLAAAMICGRIWMKVPPTIKVTLTGSIPEGVYAKDIVLALARRLRADGAVYQALEFHGPTVQQLDLEDRLVISNMSVEMGAKNGIFPADAKTYEYLSGRDAGLFEPVEADPDATYAQEITLDVSSLTPQVALPHQVDNVVGVAEVAGTPVNMVFIGTCTGGRVRDFHQAHAVLMAAGKISPDVQLVITPSSRQIYVELMRDGTLADFAAMGAVITTPGCGACCGTCGAIPGDGFNVISTANRNFKARMGNGTASIFLASPAACAAAAVTGRITDPREVLVR